MTEWHQMTVRLPDALYERLRLEAFRRRISMNEIITEALEKLLPKEAGA